MGSGRTLRKHSHTRPVKTPAEKRRRCNAQRARLVKFGMDEAVVKKMLPEDVRVLVQKPVKVKKIIAKAAQPAEAVVKAPKTPKAPKVAKAAKDPKAPKVAKAPKAAKAKAE